MLNIYCVKDVKVGYMNPFYIENDEIAVRTFKKSIVDKKGFDRDVLSKDFELFKLGEFDEKTGVIVPCAPTMLIRGIDCLSDVKEISIEDLKAEYDKLQAMFSTLSANITDKVQKMDALVISKVASMANSVAQQNKIKKILRGN